MVKSIPVDTLSIYLYTPKLGMYLPRTGYTCMNYRVSIPFAAIIAFTLLLFISVWKMAVEIHVCLAISIEEVVH